MSVRGLGRACRAARPGDRGCAVAEERRHVEALLRALSEAADALDRARRLEPDPGLDHAVERLRLMIGQCAARLDGLLDESSVESARGGTAS